MTSSTTRVLIVDDDPDVRLLLRLSIGFRVGFEVVGEAADGLAGLEAAERMDPDVIILDREMPVAGGLDVLPQLRRACPSALIVLFTATADRAVREAATIAGADAVRTKAGQSMDDLVGEIEELLLRPEEGEARMVQLRVGPVDAGAARLWVSNTTSILRALLDHPEEVPAGVPSTLLEVFAGFLDEWATVADLDEDFHWAAAAPARTIEQLVEAWADLDRLPDDAMARLGCRWSPPEAKPFFDALTLGVVAALHLDEDLEALAAGLPADWARPA